FSTGPANTVTALDGISLDVAKGEFVVLVGSNGAGKSTLLNAIAGVHRPDSGTIRLDGTDIGHLPDHRRARRIARVFQDPMAGTAASLTIRENLVLAERRSGRRRFRMPHGDDRWRADLAQLGMGL